MNALQKFVEIEPPLDRHRDLAIQNELLRLERLHRSDDLRKIPPQRLLRL